MTGAVLMVTQYAFMAWARKPLHLGLSFIPVMFRNLVRKVIDFRQTLEEQFCLQHYYVFRKVTRYRLLV